eukprot:TRINITY_DN16266_c0_g1_i6.p1 TRINITY_DN16266_c0_g1~~TRINITY_DN16266_c0_g1_i6.p1  ORF type:complete len:215 (+),score=20.41 TRINITY_DN16266_c0_g1_i6:77-721(+)
MCVAPDYILVHSSRKEALVKALRERIVLFFGADPQSHENYGRMINRRQFNRVVQYLQEGTLVHGGRTDAADLYIEPSLLEDLPPDARVMQEEIFGPVLPILTYETMQDAISIIARHPDPLALYVFTSDAAKERAWLEAVPAGGACINNASWHLTNPSLPFGGRGKSGTGAYHGRYSFETFSHRKAVLKTPTWFDPFVKYPPFKGRLNLFKWIIR